jgi:hypothetical protein
LRHIAGENLPDVLFGCGIRRCPTACRRRRSLCLWILVVGRGTTRRDEDEPCSVLNASLAAR